MLPLTAARAAMDDRADRARDAPEGRILVRLLLQSVP